MPAPLQSSLATCSHPLPVVTGATLKDRKMNDQQIEQEIQAKGLTAPRVTPQQIGALMARVQYTGGRIGETTSTVVHAFLDGNFLLASGHSACVSPENFDADLGFKMAKRQAEVKASDQLWLLEGYALRKRLEGPSDEMIDAACEAVPGLLRVDAMRALEAAESVAVTELRQALGMLAGLHPCLTVGDDQPGAMAEAIFASVQAEIRQWRDEAERSRAELVALAGERAKIARAKLAGA